MENEGPEAAAEAASLFHSQHRALSQLMAGMDSDARWLTLVGAEGSGKTTVFQALLTELERTVADIVSCDGADVAETEALFTQVSEQLALPRRETRRARAVAEIVESRKGRAPLAILIDDAESLSPGSLDALAELATKAEAAAVPLCVVLAGTPALEAGAVAAWRKAHGNEARFVRTVLGGLTPGELPRYVQRRLRGEGGGNVALSDAAIARIARHTMRLPGIIDRLCDRLASHPSIRITDRVSPDAVDEVAEELGLVGPPEPSPLRRPTAVGDEHEPSPEDGRRRRWRPVVVLAAAVVAIVLVVRFGSGLAQGARAWVEQSGVVARVTELTAVFTPAPPPEEPAKDDKSAAKPAPA
ncbi:MAG TPA: ATP-binding protein, partial [Candidatus Tectomicrobia bacterium]|nr:ATP-binding protein [Candidatus Tectomicrobia bacterium]